MVFSSLFGVHGRPDLAQVPGELDHHHRTGRCRRGANQHALDLTRCGETVSVLRRSVLYVLVFSIDKSTAAMDMLAYCSNYSAVFYIYLFKSIYIYYKYTIICLYYVQLGSFSKACPGHFKTKSKWPKTTIVYQILPKSTTFHPRSSANPLYYNDLTIKDICFIFFLGVASVDPSRKQNYEPCIPLMY